MTKNVHSGGVDFAELSAMKNNRTKSSFRQNRTTPLVVTSFGARCMAFRDRAGQLRNFWSGKVLPSPVHILDPES
jgi:hypothetical protein